MLLKDKVVLVVNAELALGKAVAVDCARQGAHVAINADPASRQAADILGAVAALGRRGFCVEGEAVEAKGAELLVAHVVEALGRIDVLINCAPPAPAYDFLSTPMDALQRAIQVGVSGIYAVLQAVARRMIAQGDGGAIITIDDAPIAQPFSAVSIAENQDLMELWADQLRSEGVRCNVVRLDPQAAKFSETASDLTGPVIFLASDLARNVSGATIRVGVGVTIPNAVHA